MCQDHVFIPRNGHCDVVWGAICGGRASPFHQFFDNSRRRDDDRGSGTNFKGVDFAILLGPLGESNAGGERGQSNVARAVSGGLRRTCSERIL